MATFKFNLDQKCTNWYRTDFDVEANSEQEAIEKARDPKGKLTIMDIYDQSPKEI